jgi:hypothetical protein
MDRSPWRESAEVQLDDGRYSFYRDQVIGGDYVIEHKGQVLARATKPSWWRSTLDVELFKRSVKLRPSLYLDRARPRFSLLALLADVETATGLDGPDRPDSIRP